MKLSLMLFLDLRRLIASINWDLSCCLVVVVQVGACPCWHGDVADSFKNSWRLNWKGCWKSWM